MSGEEQNHNCNNQNLSEELSPPDQRTESVTRPNLSTQSPEQYQNLLAGLDSLDLGVYVNWGSEWDAKLSILEELKQKACDNQLHELPLVEFEKLEPFLVLPGGKAPMYRFHLQSSYFHVWIGKSQMPEKNTPNVFVSLNSEPIWREGIEAVIENLREYIKAMGAVISRIQPSRVDLCADFHVSGGFDNVDLIDQTVCDSGEKRAYYNSNRLGSHYVGSDSAPIQMRLYCKSAEIMRNPDRAFFREIWNVPEDAEVWRVEFEIKRPALKEMGINDVYVLFRQFKSLWNYLTRQWVSMRTGEDKNKSRRPLSDFWQAVQNTESAFEGDQPIIRRVKEKSMPQAEWYLSRIRNYAETLAALWQKTSPAKVMNAIYANLQGCWAGAKFEQAVMEKAIQKGWPLVDGRDNDG